MNEYKHTEISFAFSPRTLVPGMKSPKPNFLIFIKQNRLLIFYLVIRSFLPIVVSVTKTK